MRYARTALALIGFVSAIFFPPYVAGLCIVILAACWSSWEAVLLGFFIDMLWLSPHGAFHGLPLFTLGAIILAWLFVPIRMQLLPK